MAHPPRIGTSRRRRRPGETLLVVSVVLGATLGGTLAAGGAAGRPPEPPEQLWKAFPLREPQAAQPQRPAAAIPRPAATTTAPRPASATRSASRSDRGRSASAPANGRLLGALALAIALAATVDIVVARQRRRRPLVLAAATGLQDRAATGWSAANDAINDARTVMTSRRRAVAGPAHARIAAAQRAFAGRRDRLGRAVSRRSNAILNPIGARIEATRLTLAGRRDRLGRAVSRRTYRVGARVDTARRAVAAETVHARIGRTRNGLAEGAGAERDRRSRGEERATAASAPATVADGTGMFAEAVVPPLDEVTICAIADELARARAARISLSVVVPRASAAGPRQEFAAALCATAAKEIAARSVGPYVVLPGASPRRSAELARTALEACGMLGAHTVMAGVAGAPRHARRAEELVRLARLAAERADALSMPVCIADVGWGDQGAGTGEEAAWSA